ncbi:PQQ-binding-like beta-propeller repeat protein [Chelativorans salis]|uniref:Membrane-bound PQQ-dependent dehydrogenase, glucose/quinate/shikimate family n=1 Tax=Chelativorans salis TaxID=2978478 RepID=A0ABT2LR49_9HYPH|nr:membrane-bound PQQ-dependent dehydrogenase, glucose/quinate/shikimate family [Chelativorans sp. EGI FJ00035]MCT7377021.1 membrane-bound PQQ-dependent dehydrogenase, glucose/quinate/shikimate family [Chelativorans sp. EGI FJ00035]
MYRIILSVVVLALGFVLTAGGVWLALVGGSWFYILLGILLIVSGALLLMRNAAGLALYGITLLVTLVWSIWEVGLDWWALSARGSLLMVLALLLFLPPVVRAMRPSGEAPARYGMNSMVLLISFLIAAAIGVYSMFLTPHDVAGAFSQERMAAEADAEGDVPPGEWAAYGRTSYGQRYSPLDQITPQNVSDLEVAWSYQTGEVRGENDPGETTYEVTPLMVNDTLYICTPFSTVIALDPVTGEEKWRFNPQLQQPPTQTTQHMTCRGVSFHAASPADLPATPPAAEAPQAAAEPGEEEEAVAAGEDEAQPEDQAAKGSEAEGEAQVAQSLDEVTTQAAGVPQNVVTGQAESDDPNPTVEREEPPQSVTLSEECMDRLFVPTSDGRLISISAGTGEICPGFGGEDGTVNLWANMPNVTPGSFYSTSPPVITEDNLVIIGGAVNDNAATTSPSGVIRAYDAYTGALVWNFDSKNPQATEPIPAGETYTENAPNFWSVASYDPELGLVYIPMGNESPDQYGAARGENTERFSSSVLALEAATGEVAWVFQTVHHDIWDYDVPAQPSLVDLTINEETVPALVAPTKQGDIFVLNRETGEPVLPVAEGPAPPGAVEGDFTAPMQPASAVSFRPERLTGADMWGATPIDQLYCRIRFHQLDYEGIYTPPSTNGTLVYPGNFGTFNWGGVAVDPSREVMFGMPVYLAFTVKLVPRPDDTTRVVTEEGEAIINENFGAPYAVEMGPFYSPLNLPCQGPPWGYIAGVDLRNGKTVYKHVNGTVRDLAPFPMPFEMGVPGIGGPIVTAGGVAFLSGTLDYYVRGYDLATGEEIWRARLPAGGQATPSTYRGADGRQYLVVVAGGHGSTGTEAGDSIIAYALPQ